MALSLDDIQQLSVPERILLAQDIWDTIAATPEQVPITTAQRAELDRRLTGYRNDPAAGTSWQEVKSRIRSRG